MGLVSFREDGATIIQIYKNERKKGLNFMSYYKCNFIEWCIDINVANIKISIFSL